MKNSAITFLSVTTLLLIAVVIFSTMNFPFGWIFLITCIGQVLLVYTVYKILRDDYKTDKTFEYFYRDGPDLGK